MTLLLTIVNRFSSVDCCHKDIHLRCYESSESSTVPCNVISQIFYFGIGNLLHNSKHLMDDPSITEGITVPPHFYSFFVLRRKLLVLLNILFRVTVCWQFILKSYL